MDQTRRKLLLSSFSALGSLTPFSPLGASALNTVRISVPSLPQCADVGISSEDADAELYALNLFDRLVEASDSTSSGFKLALAESIQVDPSKRHYQVELKRNVAFHRSHGFNPSRRMNADDLIFSLQRHQDPRLQFDRYYAHQHSIDYVLKSIRKSGTHSVAIETHSADPTALYELLCSYSSVIVSAEYANWLQQRGRFHDMLDRPIATGAFKLSYLGRSGARLQRHDAYWARAPQIKYVEVLETPNGLDRYTLLRTQKCHLTSAMNPKLSKALAHSRSGQPRITNVNFGFYLALGEDLWRCGPHFKHVLEQCLDRAQLNRMYFEGLAWARYSLLIDSPDYQPPRRIIETQPHAQITSNFPRQLTLLISSLKGHSPFRAARIARSLQQQLAKIGVTLQIKDVEPSERFSAIVEGEFNLALFGITPPTQGPMALLSETGLLHSKSGYLPWHVDPLLDQYAKNFKQAPDSHARHRGLATIDRHCRRHCPIIPLLNIPRIDGLNTDLGGFDRGYGGNMDFRQLRLEA